MIELFAADYRRAAASIVHWGKGNYEGFDQVLTEVKDAARVSPFILGMLGLLHAVVPVLMTEMGIASLSEAVHCLAANPDTADDASRAARLVIAFANDDIVALNGVLEEAAQADHVTHLMIALLVLYRTVLPAAFTNYGLGAMQRTVLDLAAQEAADQ